MNPVVVGSIFNALGYAVGAFLYWHEAKRRKLATDGMSRIVMIGAVAGVLLARLVERIAEGGHLVTMLDPSSGGRTILGGVIGGWIVVEISKRKMGIRTSTGPLWAVSLPAGEFFGRIGCWFNGCCFGKVCTLPWAVSSHDAMRHPTQFYLAASAALIFGVVWWGRDRVRVFPLYLVLWSTSRFIIEFYREAVGPSNGVNTAQIACLGLFAVGIFLFVKPKGEAKGD
ncbi:MAG: prolipoprotein diacylglyceryl transferase family protein [Armatimonadota bacterium]